MDFTGQLRQVPPRYSAVKWLVSLIGGPRGEPVELPVRQVRVDELRVLRFWPESTPVPCWVCCASGTFVRSLCHDMGEALGCPAHMSFWCA